MIRDLLALKEQDAEDAKTFLAAIDFGTIEHIRDNREAALALRMKADVICGLGEEVKAYGEVCAERIAELLPEAQEESGREDAYENAVADAQGIGGRA